MGVLRSSLVRFGDRYPRSSSDGALNEYGLHIEDFKAFVALGSGTTIEITESSRPPIWSISV
jgi:hypothetical protein